jgi:acetyl-CoA carboxylase biotin carboxyl carrier protein
MPTSIAAHITGTVWKVVKEVGDSVEQDEPVVILESMKMELPVESPVAGKVTEIRCKPGDSVEEGAVLALVEPAS